MLIVSAASKTAALRLAVAAAAAVFAVVFFWAAGALAQGAPPPVAPTSPWLTPTAVYGGLSILAACVGWVFRWSSGQDKRIDAAATKEELRKSIADVRDAVADLGKIVTLAQSRDSCALLRQEEATAVADLERGLGARITVDERRVDRLLERMEGFVQSARGLDEIKVMVSQLYQAGGFTPLPAPRPARPVGRQTTQPVIELPAGPVDDPAKD